LNHPAQFYLIELEIGFGDNHRQVCYLTGNQYKQHPLVLVNLKGHQKLPILAGIDSKRKSYFASIKNAIEKSYPESCETLSAV
jgi:hypothetical protein